MIPLPPNPAQGIKVGSTWVGDGHTVQVMEVRPSNFVVYRKGDDVLTDHARMFLLVYRPVVENA